MFTKLMSLFTRHSHSYTAPSRVGITESSDAHDRDKPMSLFTHKTLRMFPY